MAHLFDNRRIFDITIEIFQSMNDNPHRVPASQILVTMAALIIVVAGMRAAVDILIPFLLAVFIAIISTPALFWLQQKKIPTWLSMIIIIAILLSALFLIGALLGSSINDFSTNLPSYEAKLSQQIGALTRWINKIGIDTSGLAITEMLNPGSAMKIVGVALNSLSKVLTNGFLILMTVIFILLEASGMPLKLRRVIGDPEHSLAGFDSFITNVKQYMAIKTIVSLITAILVAGWLTVIGLDYPILWAVLAFFLNYIPNIGSIIAAVPAVLLAIVQLGFLPAGLIALGYMVVNLVMGNVIEPRFMGKGLGLSTLVVFLSLIFWGWVLGPVGMLLSVPLTITAKIALDSREETRWLSVLLGPAIPDNLPPTKDTQVK